MAARVENRAPAIGGAAMATVGITLAVATLALTILDRESPPPMTLAGLDAGTSLVVRTLVETAGLITTSLVGGIIVWRQPKALLSLVVVVAVASLSMRAFASEYAVHGLLAAPGSLPLADAAAWSQAVIPDLLGLSAILFLLLFPDGTLMSRRWWPLIALAIAVYAADALISLDNPYPFALGLMAQQWVPVTLPPAVWLVGASVSWAAGVVSSAKPLLTILAAAYVLRRLFSGSGEARQQLAWFAYAAGTFSLTGLLGMADSPPGLGGIPDTIRTAVTAFTSSDAAHAIASWSGLGSAAAGMVLIPIAVAFAIVRYRLYDIDVVINRTILYAGLAAFVAAGYGIVVVGIGSLAGQRAGLGPPLTILTIAVVAGLLEPVRSRLQALANVAVYGRRAGPYEVLSDFARSVGRAESADVLLPRLAELLRNGTGTSKAEIWVRIGDRLHLTASSPPPAPGPRPSAVDAAELAGRLGPDGVVIPVADASEPLGALAVTVPRGQALSANDRRLLADVASQAGLVFSRFRLVQELRESRARIVTAQDLERRRIERNLHDGAQQRFVNALLTLGMAQAQPGRRFQKQDLVAQASEEVRAGLAELRELARGVHPPLLSESGLPAAIGSLADRSPIFASVHANTQRRFPVAVETTAYYVVAEGLANAAKHSRAGSVEVTIAEDSGLLRVVIADDGAGGAHASAGSGLVGLQDRVAAIGGTLAVTSPKGKGTIVAAELPCE